MRIVLFVLSTFILQNLSGQELDFQVTINIPALKTADPQTLQKLEQEISLLLNQTTWTDDTYLPEERISCSLQINIKDDPTSNIFLADFYITSSRPVFNSDYNAPIINHVDKDVRFTYEEKTPLRDNRLKYTDELSAILTFYVYVILGYDADTFASLGGDQYFKIAEQIVNSAPPTASPKWRRSAGTNNRYWLIQNLLDTRVRRMRIANYEYHRNGLDRMYDDVSTGKAVILSSIKEIGQVNELYRNSLVIQIWGNTKSSEILEVFKNSIKTEQRQVYEIMEKINPSLSGNLNALR